MPGSIRATNTAENPSLGLLKSKLATSGRRVAAGCRVRLIVMGFQLAPCRCLWLGAAHHFRFGNGFPAALLRQGRQGRKEDTAIIASPTTPYVDGFVGLPL